VAVRALACGGAHPEPAWCGGVRGAVLPVADRLPSSEGVAARGGRCPVRGRVQRAWPDGAVHVVADLPQRSTPRLPVTWDEDDAPQFPGVHLAVNVPEPAVEV